MLNLDNKQYDLNTLFSFEVLKEILLKLARGQINLEEKVQNIINVYQNKENAEKEKYVNISETDDNNLDLSKDLLNDEEEKSKLSGIIENKEINQSKNPKQAEINNPPKNNFDSEFKEKDSNKENNENKNSSENNKEVYKDNNKNSSDKNKEEEKKENNVNENISEKNKEEENKDDNKNEVKVNDENENKTERDQEENEEIIKNEIKAKDESENKIEEDKEENKENKYINNEEKENGNQEKNEISNKDEISQSKRNSEKENNKIHTNGKSADLIKNILRAIKENKERISNLEKELIKEKERNKKDFKSHEQNNYNDFDSLRKKLNELSLKLAEYDSKIENCEIKCSNFDVMNMFKDNGDGNIDAAKVMVKSLEEKIFKKFELFDEKNKNEKSDSININSKIDLLFEKINRDRQNIEKLYSLTGENKEAIDQIKKDLQERTNEIRKLADEGKNTSKKLDDAKKSLNKKIKELSEKLNSEIEELKNKIDSGSLFKLGINNEFQVDKEVIDDINLKINDLRKRYNELDSSFKFHLANNKADYLDIEVQKMKASLDKKITLDDLKELYNLHLGDLDEINDTKNKISVLYEQVKRALSSIQSLTSKLENLTTNVSLMQSIQSSGNNNTGVPTQGIIDFSKFVDSQKLNDTVKPLIKEMQKMFQEVYSLRREMDDVQNLNKESINKETLDKLEENINEKINELKNIIHKKYLEKAEHYKAVKHLEAQIKVQVEENKKDSESWIMAKRPLKCFNCATCESNIKNMSPSNDYLPWNKYPPGEKIYRMGQGFSHMLQMMTNEFVKNVEKNANELQKENEQSHKSLNLNTINDMGRVNTNFVNNEKTLIGLSINNRHHHVEDPQQTVTNIRKSGKVRLPLMTKFMKAKKPKNGNDIPVSDEEGDNNNDLFDKFKILGSPKIMKIIKKKNSVSKSVAISDLNDKNFATENYTQNEDIKDNFGQSRNSKN